MFVPLKRFVTSNFPKWFSAELRFYVKRKRELHRRYKITEGSIFKYIPYSSKKMNVSKTHELLKPLLWIMGEWKSISAVVSYPTMKSSINYSEKLSFTSLGQPLLNYRSVTWNDKDGSPMHSESGFLRIDEDGTSVALITAQMFGVAAIEHGFVKDEIMITNSSHIGHMKFVKHRTVSIHRCYKLNEKGQLEYKSMLETPETPLTLHLTALYEKCI